MIDIETARRKANKIVAEAAHQRKRWGENHRARRKAKAEYRNALGAREIIQNTAAEVQRAAHASIAAIVSRCLEAIFDEPYKFKIHFEMKRGRTEARLAFLRDESEIDPLTASGGGVVDVAAFALRLACLALSKPALRRVIVMDEPFRFLSAGYRPNIRELLEGLSEDLGVQIIMVTHIEDLEIGKIVEF